MANKRKYLIETSAVPVALGESTPSHCNHFVDAVADGTCWTSIYIRKEFLARWVCYYVRMAFAVDHFQDLASALYHLEQSFSIRDVKAGQHALAALLQQKGRIENTRTMAKELARLAVGTLRKFDRRFRSRTSNSCGCEIGGKELKVDFNDLFEDLRTFLRLVDTVDDCPINSFLRLGRKGPSASLLNSPDVRQRTKSGENLTKLRAEQKWITCKECRTIGDAVIVLDQSPSWCLVHIDKDFEILCKAAGREHKPIQSERAIEKIARKNE
jgi:hypothetical protein